MAKDGSGVGAGDNNTASADKYFFFQNLAMPIGNHDLNIVVRDGDRDVISFSKQLKVNPFYEALELLNISLNFSSLLQVLSGPPASFSVLIPDESIGKTIPLGGCLPDFHMNFFDGTDNPANFSGQAEVMIECKELTVTCCEEEGPWVFEVSKLML